MIVKINTYDDNNSLSNLGFNIDVNSKGVDRSRIVSSNLQQYSFIEENGDRVENDANLAFSPSNKYIYINNDTRAIITDSTQPSYSFYNGGWYNGFNKSLKIAYVNSLFCDIDYDKKIFNQNLTYQWHNDIAGDSNCLFYNWLNVSGANYLATTFVIPIVAGAATTTVYIPNSESSVFSMSYRINTFGFMSGTFDTTYYIENNSGSKSKQISTHNTVETSVNAVIVPNTNENLIGRKRFDIDLSGITFTDPAATSLDFIVILSGIKRELVF